MIRFTFIKDYSGLQIKKGQKAIKKGSRDILAGAEVSNEGK